MPGTAASILCSDAPVSRQLRPPLLGRFYGDPIRLSYVPAPRAVRGRLISGGTHGAALDGCSFIRERRVVLAEELREFPDDHQRVLLHELFHFAWARLGNPARRSFEDVLAAEWCLGVKGELGWPATEAKGAVQHRDANLRSQRWRHYVCESFCDTAAWHGLGHSDTLDVTLAPGQRLRRRQWMEAHLLPEGMRL